MQSQMQQMKTYGTVVVLQELFPGRVAQLFKKSLVSMLRNMELLRQENADTHLEET